MLVTLGEESIPVIEVNGKSIKAFDISAETTESPIFPASLLHALRSILAKGRPEPVNTNYEGTRCTISG